MVADLGSAALPGLQDDDHVRGALAAPLLIAYSDLECPFCAVLHSKAAPLIETAKVRWAFRHFPLRSAHPRAWAAACAVEAAALQGGFWELHDLLINDQGRLEDPHLWARAGELGLDVERFEVDRRSDAVLARVKRDFHSGVRAGVVSTPTVFSGGLAHEGAALDKLLAALA
jgi:protein-disulfide isomerase